MKKHFFLISFIGITSLCYSNNILVTNVALTGQNTVSDFTLVQFDISWDNSWKTSTLESNWDAAWVFVKYRLKTQTTWNHATLNGGAGGPADINFITPSDGKGIFLLKNADGIGPNAWPAVKVKWEYGIDGLQDNDSVEVCVFAIEMVYIPQGAFDAGDGTDSNIQGQFEEGTSGDPFQVTSEAAIVLGGGGAGSLGNNNADGMSTFNDDFDDATPQTLPADFPKGFSAYYIMKYEISQEQYAEFLNKLTYTQQATRTISPPNSLAGTAALFNLFRNGIDIQTPGVSTATPAVYACNLNGNVTYSAADDGQNIACNYLSWADVAAYLDWSGLRPLTELEYEKACRGGTLSAVADEYAWGNITITGATGITNSGLTNEIASNAGANCVYDNAAGVQGPMRVGNFAQGAANRQNSGGSYYGVMELSGNISERTIMVGDADGRTFTGINGDGNLDAATGTANAAFWPGNSAIGAGFRGGGWDDDAFSQRVSDRKNAALPDPTRINKYGGRGGRIAP